jgi:ubiquinone/menaquinone biosynthesis C-methylase UbiE
MSITGYAINTLRRISPTLPHTISRWWFEHISTYDSGTHMLFMNYGYSALDPADNTLQLSDADEPNRYFIQLYHQVAGAVDLQGKDVVEVGCGRGGGISFVQRYLHPRSSIGLDLTHNAIKFCQKHYQAIPHLTFQQGDAQALPIPDQSIDVLLNVESSLCYPDVEQFFAEVVRVLKPGGYFLYADLRPLHQWELWHEQLARIPLKQLAAVEISANVVRALELDSERKQKLIEQHAPRIFHKPFAEFAGLPGSEFFYGALATGKKRYKRFVFQK